MPAYDAVVFDCDGVLVDSEVLSSQVSRRILADLGWDVDLHTLMETYTGCSAEFFRAAVERNTGRRLAPDWLQPYRPWFEEAFRKELREVAGISAALDSLDVPTAVASNSDHERIRLSLELVGLLPRFEGRISSARDVPRGKPAPDVYLHAADMLKVLPERCIAVEDSAFGIEAARSAGMRVLAYQVGPTHVDEKLRTTVFRRMSILPYLIADLRSGRSV